MKIDKRRRIENKTDYRKRLILLKGKVPRFIVRKTNKYIILQIITSKSAQDKVVYSINTKELLKFGWPEERKGSLKSISAGYLGGFLLGKKTKGFKSEVILDIGLIPNTKGSRVYAAVKGLLDSGVKIKCSQKILPSKEMLEGKFTKIKPEIFNKIKDRIDKLAEKPAKEVI